jgi:hypothetical protein
MSSQLCQESQVSSKPDFEHRSFEDLFRTALL